MITSEKKTGIHTVPGLFSPAECRNLIQRAQSVGYAKASLSYPPSYRNNDRLVIDDHAFAATVFERVRPFLPHKLTDADGTQWKLQGINERFRFCRYEAGQFFKIHRDSAYYRDDRIRSKLTFMVYLNGQEEFKGGLTRFFETRDPQSNILAAIPPVAGMLIYFDHDLWHDGQELSEGEKFIMRSDILYERVASVNDDPGHAGYVWTLAELPDGTLASGGRDKTIKIWNRSPELSCEATLTGHKNSVTALIARNSGEVWSASRDRTIRMWQKTADGFQQQKAWQAHGGAILTLAKSPNEAIIASGSADQTIRLWDARGDLRLELRGHTDWVWSLQFISSETFISASEDGTLRLWSAGLCLGVFQAGSTPLRTSALSPDGHELAVGHADGTITLWSVSPRHLELKTRIHAHAGEVRALAYTQNMLISGAEDDHVKFWSLATATVLRSGSHGDFVTSLTRLSDGSLLSTSYDGHLRCWESP